MNKRKMLLASFGALSLTVVVPAGAAGPGTMSPAVAPSPQMNAALLAQLDARRAARGQDARYGYAVINRHPGTQGTQIARVAHTFQGVPIFGFESVLVLDANGRIVSESDSEQRANFVKPDAVGPGTDFSIVPAISPKAAIDAALASLGAPARHETPPSAEPIIWPALRTERLPDARDKAEQELNALDVQDVVDHYELAYFVHTRMVAGDKPLYHDTIVSARDGSILAQWTMLQTVVGVGHSQYNGDVPINTTPANGKYRMIDDTRGTGGTFGAMAITNANHGTSAGEVYVNDTNTWGDGKQYVSGARRRTRTGRRPPSTRCGA